MLSMPRLTARTKLVLVALCLCLIASLQAVTRASATTAVSGGISQAYNPGRGTAPSVDAEYTGEALTVQTGYVGRGAAEPTIGVDKAGNAFVAAGQFDGLARVLPRTFVMKSSDGGTTWSKTSPMIPGTTEPNPPVTADPMVVLDQETGRLFNPELYGACNYMGISDDQGKTWISNPAACGNLTVDHQTVAVAPFPPNLKPLQRGYPNVVYYCANRIADANCGRSLDGGLAWSATPTPAFLGYDPAAGGLCGGLHGHLDGDSQGRIFLPKGHCGKPWLAVSEDGGNTWTRTKVSDMRSSDTHLSVATDAADNVYVLWPDENRLPWLAVSTDHGKTFGEPMMVAPPGVKETAFAVMEAGDAGKVSITFLGNTSGDRKNLQRPWNQYLTLTENVFDANPLFVSTTANPEADPIIRGGCEDDASGGGGRCGGVWDFIDIQTSPADGMTWVVGADGCQKTTCTKTGGRDENSMTGEGFAVRQLTGPRIRTISAAPTTP